MNGRERFLTALAGRQPDRVPIFDFLCQKDIFKATIGRRPDTYNGRDVAEASFTLGLDAAWIPFGGYPGLRPDWIEEGVTYRDEWGVAYQIAPVSWPDDAPVDFPITSRDDLKGYKPPDPTQPGRIHDIGTALEIAQARVAILGGVRGPFSQAWYLLGPERLLMSFYDDPQLITALFKISNEYHIEAARIQAEAGIDAFFIFDDMGYRSGPFISLEHYRKFLLPYVQELVSSLMATGKPVIFHSDGCISSYLDDMVEAGISGIHPLQRTAGMDLRAVKEKYGQQICILGNVDSSVTLPYGSVEDVEKEVKECIRIASPDGGYVLSSDHSLHDGIPMENIWAMIEAGKRWGDYSVAWGQSHSRIPEYQTGGKQ